MQTLTVSIVQAKLHWHDAQKNREQFASIIRSINDPTDLIVLPEMFTSGFTMDAAGNAETMDGKTLAWMREMAAASGASICGSLIIEENGSYYNRFVHMPTDGEPTTYDKRHLFRLANEHHHYAPGNKRVIFELKGFRICPMICYDLRFPAWCRNRHDYDLLIYVANWPSRRHFAWETLLRARAIENMSYVIGVNRNGVDNNELPYVGGSSVINYLGADLANLQDRNDVTSVILDKTALSDFRERLAFHKDADDFTIKQ